MRIKVQKRTFLWENAPLFGKNVDFLKKHWNHARFRCFFVRIMKMLLIFANRCINIYIKVDESGVKGWKVDKVDNFVDN